MAVGSMSLRCCRSIAGESLLCSLSRRFTPLLPPKQALQPRRSFTSTGKTSTTIISDEDSSPDPDDEDPTNWNSSALRTRLTPKSPSYFTGNSDFVDNWLALQALLRKYQTFPTIPADQAPPTKWKTLSQYRSAVGSTVKAAKYKKIIGLLNRLNRIDPSLITNDTKAALEMYKRTLDTNAHKQKIRTLDRSGKAYGTGRRKTSVARVYVVEGDGEVRVNGKELVEVFKKEHDRESAVWPLLVTDRLDRYNVWAVVEGGGSTGQAEAMTLGVARALMVHEPDLKPALRRAGCVTRDPRAVERKKPGHVKARKMPTWVKR